MILGHIFYAIGLIVALVLFSIISRFGEFYNTREWIVKYQLVTGKKPEKTDFRSEQEYSNFITLSLFDLFDFVWTFAGVLTSSWYIFASLLVWSIISNILRVKIKFEPLSRFLSFQLLCVKFISISYLIMNHFHLHQDIWKLFFN